MPNNTLEKWEEKPFEKCIENIQYTNKIPKKDFKDNGLYPIISQEDEFINGYWNDKKDLFIIKKPVVIFGDHTKKVKYIDFDFVLGADGVKIISTIDNILPKYMYYYLQNIQLRDLGYARHYKLLKEKFIQYPNIHEQQRIVGILDEAFENIDKAKQNALQNLNNTKELFENKLCYLFNTNTELWKESILYNICEKISAGGDKPEIFSETKTIECNIPIYSNGIKDNGLYGYTNNPTIVKPAITISARGTIGFICKRLEPYCPIVRLISLIPKDFIDLSFLAYAMNFVIPKNTGTSIPQLTVPNLKNNIIRYPSTEEQQKIVQQLDELQEQTKKLEQIYEQKIKDLDELKQSILQKAFNGEL